MRLCTLALPSLWFSAAAAFAVGCGQDWGQVQRYGSCGDCELVIKVEGIFDPMAVPNVQQIKWLNEPTAQEEGYPSLLKNFNFSNDVDGWQAEPAVSQYSQRQALALTTKAATTISQPLVAGSSQCLPVDANKPYQLKASVLLPDGVGKAAASLEFFSADLCSGDSLSTLASPSVLKTKTWRQLSLFAIAPVQARSARVRFFLVKESTSPAFTALFDNALFNHAGGQSSL